MTTIGSPTLPMPVRSSRLAAIAGFLARRLTPFALGGIGLALILDYRQGQLAESWLQGHLLTSLGMHVHRLQTAVLFDVRGQLAGVSLTAGCTAGPLLGVFFLATAVLSWFRSFPLHRILLGAVELAAVFLLANQLRIGAIVLAMRRWGFHRGYEFSHVFLGSAITTIGFVAGIVIFVRLVVRRPEGRAK